MQILIRRKIFADMNDTCTISTSEVNNAPNVTIIQKQHIIERRAARTPDKAKMRSSAMEEQASHANRSHAPCTVVEIKYT
jgi:hypothetical protein